MKLLAALDLASTTPAVLREARLWAGRLGAELWLIHVADPDPDFVGYVPGPETVRDAMARKFHREHRDIEAAAEGLRKEGVNATALLLQGATADTILREADRLDAAAILMGTRAHGPIRDLLLGSVSRQVLNRAIRPVLLIPPHDAG